MGEYLLNTVFVVMLGLIQKLRNKSLASNSKSIYVELATNIN